MNGDPEKPGVPCSIQGCLICILFDFVFFVFVLGLMYLVGWLK